YLAFIICKSSNFFFVKLIWILTLVSIYSVITAGDYVISVGNYIIIVADFIIASGDYRINGEKTVFF
uniref:hypothetical protein n=1 Tax=uncultured Parabacteroides sp. TaxID=512312 RepID=UPI0025D09F01